MHAMAELRKEVVRILDDHGVKRVEFDKDGAGHQVAKFDFRRRSMRFHFPSTTKMNGHTHLNVLGRLKRELRAIAPPPKQRPTITVKSQEDDCGCECAPVKHSLRREEKIHKRFTAGENPDLLAAEFHISKGRLYQIIREENARLRGEKPKPLLILARGAAPTPEPAPAPIPAKPARKTQARLVERNKAIAAAYKACRNFSKVGRMFDNLTGARVKQIIKDMGVTI